MDIPLLIILIILIVAVIVLIAKRRKESESEIKVVRLKDLKRKGVLAEVEDELEEFEEIEEEEEDKRERRFDEIVIADGFGEIIYTTGKESLVDPFYVFPYADRIIVESDKCETFVKLENGFIYIKSNRPVDSRSAKRIAKKIIKNKTTEKRLKSVIS